MPAATLLCTKTFIYANQSVIHGRQEYNSAFGRNVKLSETSSQLGLKLKVKKSIQLGRRRPVFTTRSGGGGGGGVDSIIERDDKLRKLTQAILWNAEGGDPVWAISSETVNDLVGLSLNFFFILPLLNAGGIHLVEAPVLHPMSEGLFNFVIGWTFMFAPLLFSDRKRDRFKGSLDLLWGFQMFLTNTFLIPYMAIRLNKGDSEYPPRATSQLGSIMTRGASVVGLVGGAACLLSTFWAFYGSGDGDFGSISDRWEFLLNYLSSERLAYAFIWDICNKTSLLNSPEIKGFKSPAAGETRFRFFRTKSKLLPILQVIGIDLLSQSLLPAIVELAEDRHWRVRLAIIEYIPLLARQYGVEFFDDKLGTLCMQWLQDEVYSIRDAAANNLKRLAEEFGPEWAMQHIIPQVLDVINNSHYLYRITILRAISLLAPVMGSEITCSKLLPVVITAAKDRVPNIKFNVAKVLQSFIPVVDQSVRTLIYLLFLDWLLGLVEITIELTYVAEKTIRSSLVELAEDPDVDVHFYASQALQSIDDVMLSS
ncbi:hypothetical protein RDI58_009738 [Solanum bulbocastanum]|uniref:Uncharacterized protein n=1 Tax=Solanum bulbocastanum TaxID=147425 RepID=A0AAN8TSN4_SOLBU